MSGTFNNSRGRKKSLFPTATSVAAGANIDFFVGGTNYQITYTNFLAGLGVTGSLEQAGAVTGTPVLDIDGTVNKIRNLEAGSGMNIVVSPENGITLTSTAGGIFESITGEGQVPSLSADLLNYEYSGATVDPITREWTFDQTINVPAGSITVGTTMELSEGGQDLVVTDLVTAQMAFSVNSDFSDATGADVPSYIDFGAPIAQITQPVFDTVITTNPLTISFTIGITPPTNLRLIDQITLKANGPMINTRFKVTDVATGLVLRYVPNKAAYDGDGNGFDLVTGDNTFFLAGEGTDSGGNFFLGYVPFVTRDGQELEIEIIGDTVDLLGNGIEVPYFAQELHEGPGVPLADIFDTSNIADNYLRLNNQYVPVSAVTGGIVINYLPTATSDTVTAGAFTAGVASTTNPTVITDGSATFAQNDLVQISGSRLQDGIFEVDDHTGTTLTIRGVGSVPAVEDFTRDDFSTAIDNAVITKINVAVLQSSTDGIWKFAKGSETPLSFNFLAPAAVEFTESSIPFANSSGLLIQDNANLNFNDGTDTLNVQNLTVNGTFTTVDVETLSVSASHIVTNAGYETNLLKPGGLVVNYLPTTTVDTVTAGAFVAGIAATSNPTVITDGSATFAQNDIIQILGTANTGENDGLYEVEDHTGTTLTIRGIGTVSVVLEFTKNQFIANASDNASIVKVNMSDLHASTGGGWQFAAGATSDVFDYKNLVYDTIDAYSLKAPVAGSATIDFLNSSDVTKATIEYDESADEFSIDVANGLSSLFLNEVVEIFRGTTDGRIDIEPATAAGSALLTLSNFAGGTALAIRHDDATDDNIISADIGNLSIRTTTGTEDILFNATGDIAFAIQGYAETLALEEGTYGNANSTNLILNKGDGGTNQSEFVLFNDSNATEISRYFRMGYVDEIATQGGLNISDANNFVSIGTRTDPDSVLHIYEDTTETGDQAGLTIEQDGTGDAIAQFLLSGGQRWVAGIDNSGSDAFKIASSLDLGSNAQLVLETDGRSEFLGELGVNILPASTMHVYEDTAEVGAAAGLTIEQDGTGDAIAQFLLSGAQRWVMGIDNSFDDNFVFAKSADLNSSQQLVLQADGKNNFYGTLGVGKIPDDGYRLDVLTSISTVVGLSSFKAVTIEAGNNGSGNSTDLFFNRGNVGFNQSEFTMFNDNNASGPARMFRMGYSDDIDTSGGLTVWKTRNNVAVGTYSLPDSVFTVSEDTTETGDQAGLTIIQEGTGDAIAQFLLDGGQRWVMGIDNSGNDAFKIASSINLGSNDMFVLEPDAGAFINSHTDDVLTLGNSTGEQSKISIDDAGSPEGVVTGTGGDDHINVDGALSIRSFKKSASSSTADWYDYDLVPPLIKVIYNTAEFEDMATAGVITVSSNTTWIFKGHIDSDVRVVFDGATLHISTDQSNQASWTYSGTGTLLTGSGGLRSLEFMDLLSSSTGTFADLDMDGRSMNLTLAGLFNWDDLGSLSNGTFILDVSDIFDNVLGFDFFNMKVTITQSNISNTPTGATPMFTIDNSFGPKSVNLDQLTGTFNSGASLFRFEPALNDAGKVAIGGVTTEGGTLFDVSGSTGTFTVVADASVPAEAITSVTDSSGVARFNFTAPPTLFVNQEVVISGFTTNTAYNGTFIITATGANFFEVATIAFGSDETGSFLSNSVTLTDTATTLVDGDQITIDTDASIDYDGGAVVYNQLTNTFQVNRTWAATETGTWSTEGLDQTDPRILAFNNPDFADSRYLAFGHIEDNPLLNTTVIGVTDTYQAIDLTGTTGSITIFADNAAGGTTCTSTAHGLLENQNIVISAGDSYYHGEYTIFNVLTNTFDIAITFQSTVLTSTWVAGFQCDNERFKCTDLITGEITYIGNEPFEGSAKITWSVNKVGSSQDYIFSVGKNGVSPQQGAAYQKRTVTTATSVHPVTVPLSLVEGDTVQPILASVGTTNSILVENLQMEIS